ncbi:MAG: AAA family ATPase [Candidatus Thiodiazotropha sp.]
MRIATLSERELAALPCIHEGNCFRLHLQAKSTFGQPVIIKSLRTDAGEKAVKRLENEYRQTVDLHFEGIRRPRSQLLVAGRHALALDYVNGETLTESHVKQRKSLAENLQVAIAIANSLEELHRRKLIHRNIASAHILVSYPPLSVTLIGFGDASIEKESGIFAQSDLSFSILSTISPEQTGRVNRRLDHRTDLYSFGAVLYELFTGKPLFEADDAAEWIYSHLAREPLSPHELNPELPIIVSDLVMRLLAKNPEERYQSAYGVWADLTAIQKQLHVTGQIGMIRLAQADYSSVFRLSDRFYDRKAELKTLQAAVTDAVNGSGSIMLVSGHAGSGKTALLEAVREYSVEQGANFIVGTHQGSQRHIPYVALRHAFDEWIDLILAGNAQQLEQWKNELLEVCAGNAGLLVDMLPKLKLVIGEQPPVPELGPAEANHRFHHLFRSFLIASSRKDQPLVLALDNLQWADHATVQLLIQLLPGIDTLPIVILVAYRDDEVGTGHPLSGLLDSNMPSKSRIQTLYLEPFPLETVNQLIADTLKTDPLVTGPLAQLVLEKSGGNPLFIRQFMQSLYETHILEFDSSERCWGWSIDTIRRQPIIGSAIDLQAEKIGKLPDSTRSALAIAACIGTEFRSRILAAVAKISETEMTEQLHPAIEAGLLQVTTTKSELGEESDLGEEISYEFPHDRVCQAAYALQPQKQQRLNHLHIGRLLLSLTGEDNLEDWIFEISDQFNQGFQYIEDEKERRQLVALNLMAGRKARRAAAYQAAIRYLSMGIGLLPSDRWKSTEEPTLELFLEAIEAEYFSANFERAALLSDEVLKHTGDLFIRLRVYEMSIRFFTAQSQYQSAIEAGISALAELGIVLTESATDSEHQQLVALAGRIETLAHLPAMNDSRHLASLRIMTYLVTPAQRTNLQLFKTLIGKMVLLSSVHGNSPMGAFAYGWYAALLCSSAGNIDAGYRFGRLSLEIMRLYPAAELKTRVKLLFNAYVRHWKEPVLESTSRLQKIYRQGIETGDLEYTSLGAVHHIGYMLCTGLPLELIRYKQQEYLQTIDQWRLPFQGHLLRVWLQTATNLCSGSGDPTSLTGEFFDETKHLPGRLEDNNDLLVFNVLCSRTMLQYIFGNYAGAVISGKLAEKYSQSALGLYYWVSHTVYYALALLAHHNTLDMVGRTENLELVIPLIDRLRRWAVLSPVNFSHNLALVEAEQARALGDIGRTIECFNQAVSLARKNGQQLDEALVCEREAAFYSAQGREDFARLALQKAVHGFRSWGAIRKVELLEQQFKTQTHPEFSILDTATVLKASQMLSQEVHLEQLLEKLMRIVIENAGAVKGLLIQNSSTGLMIQARGDSSGVETMQALSVEGSGEVPLPVINYVARTHKEVVLSDAQYDPTFASDSYISKNRTRSLLCLPIVYQGKLSGLFYLENNLASDVFTIEHLQLLKTLASQAAISLENATLYAELESKIAALRESEQKFRVIFDHTFQFIGVLDTEGTLLQANRTALQFAGVDIEAVIGKPFWETPWWGHSVELQERLKRAVLTAAKGKLVRFEASHPSPDGNVSYVDFSLKPVINAQGEVVQLIPEGRDITERKHAEDELMRYKEHLEETVQQRTDELRLARDEAEAANRAKSVFLANMSHELRTPLNAILGFSQVMQRDENLDKEQHETLNIINTSGEHLLKLINDVLEIAKIEAGKLQLELATFDLHALVREVTDMMRLRAEQKGLKLELDQASEFPRYIKGDEARLRQILVNLVSNAVKFTEKGGVTISLGVKDNNHRQLLLDIEDTGSGISESDQQRLFMPFEQLPEGKTQIGTGLGLSIVQHFVMLMDGNISVESSLGMGTRFLVELPLNEADEMEMEHLAENPLGEVSGLSPGQKSYRILIAEDQRDDQILLVKLITQIGMEVKVAKNGEECVEKFKEWKPDLIWMDRRMPVMDGVEATRQIRRLPGGKKVKIVAVTASAFKEQEPEMLDAGMDDYIRKPFLFGEIYDSLAKQLGVQFTYYREDNAPKVLRETLTPQLMNTVTDEQREALRLAVVSLDRENINNEIEQIAKDNEELGNVLLQLVGEFDYPTILSAIDGVTKNNPPTG